MRRLLFIASLLLLVILTTVPAHAQTTWEQRDQANLTDGMVTVFSQATQFQTFTAGITGELTRVKIAVRPDQGWSLTVEIRTVDSNTGIPTGTPAAGTGTIIASTSISAGSEYTLTDVVFSTPPDITAGTTYAIVAIPGGGWRWKLSNTPNPYSGGRAGRCDQYNCYFPNNEDSDYVFETYVDAPDTTAPTGTISINDGAIYTNNPNVALNLTCEDAASGCDEMDFSINGGAWSTPTPFAATSSATLPAGNGERTVSVRFYDVAGNVSATISDTIVLDTIDPQTLLFEFPHTPTTSKNASFEFSGVDGGGIAGFECQLDNGLFASCGSGISYSNLPDGWHTFKVRAVDHAGNVDDSPSSVSWKIDTTAPTATINQAADQADPTNATSVAFTVTFSEPVSGLTHTDFDVSTTGTSFSTINVSPSFGPASSYRVTIGGVSGNGTIAATFNAGVVQDAAGLSNATPTSTDNSITIDQTAPTTTATVNGLPPLDGWYQSATVTLAPNEDATTTYKIGTGPAQTYGAPFVLPDGEHTITFRSTDTANNTEADQTLTVKVDGTAPMFQPLDDLTLDPTSPAGAPVVFTPLVSDNLSSAGTITATCTDQNSNPFTSGQIVPIGTTTTITCTATDLAGNTASENFSATVLGVNDLFVELRTLIATSGLPISMQRMLLAQSGIAEAFANGSRIWFSCIQLSIIDLQVHIQEFLRRISHTDAAEIYAQTMRIRVTLGCDGSVR